MTTIHVFARRAPRLAGKPVAQPKKSSSAQYITDDMLLQYVPSFFPTSQVELTIRAENLASTHLISKSNVFCIVSMKRPWQDKWMEVSRTELLENTQDPQWVNNSRISHSLLEN